MPTFDDDPTTNETNRLHLCQRGANYTRPS